ncbi:hypothetical protein I3843_04G079700 [Carya illinoinensis]|uniref:Uncharacterized protein n=1 Tax=Carya illinoinensis TaxID=32201 RepID=A0A8T1QT38_CARIL|nr:uncharacterized protein LOC122307043 [Carya illinoinensis]KAG6657373.1 hypothetical protein CIPAW_04G086300 [Carya illinoinensis]KAG6717186.1 hypothetical protein I3842_04G085500 [Carya illinoinensis]KAG7982959.1 hypothetical protein I3843_04G079700 [Carya illinoinensis]
MSSFEDERLVQMVEEFIESESPSPIIFSASSKCRPLNHRTQYLALHEILGSGTKAEVEILESVLRHMRSKRDADKTSSLKKWLVMRLKRDGYKASLCQTSWITSLGCPAGDYEYIDIRMEDDESGNSKKFFVDVDFKSQFELARPTTTYKELTETLPQIFVGTEDKLNNIISLLCSAAKQSLRERGLHIPPWRTTTYMQSKWLSGCTHKVSADKRKAKGVSVTDEYSNWTPSPPRAKPNRQRNLGGGSALSSQFSGMSINCC